MPLRRRPFDLVLLAFIILNATFITYVVDIEQIVIPDTSNFDYPFWPPAPMVDIIHDFGRTTDHLLFNRPPFYQMTIWIDAILFGPFYYFAIYAFIRGRNWIRVPALVWSGMMMANVLIILMEERFGQFATPNFPLVLALNAPWFLLPVAMIWRMRKEPFPPRVPASQEPAKPTADATAAA
jgi:hypothetical protein